MTEIVHEEKNTSLLNMNSHTEYSFAKEKDKIQSRYVSTMIQNANLQCVS